MSKQRRVCTGLFLYNFCILTWYDSRSIDDLNWWFLNSHSRGIGLRCFNLCHLHWAFPEKNCTPPPCWRYRFFWSWTPWISSQIYRELEFSIFFALAPLEIHVFSSIFGAPGIPTTFTLLNRGGGLQFFFWKNKLYDWLYW